MKFITFIRYISLLHLITFGLFELSGAEGMPYPSLDGYQSVLLGLGSITYLVLGVAILAQWLIETVVYMDATPNRAPVCGHRTVTRREVKFTETGGRLT
jgi:hypothetical protein